MIDITNKDTYKQYEREIETHGDLFIGKRRRSRNLLNADSYSSIENATYSQGTVTQTTADTLTTTTCFIQEYNSSSLVRENTYKPTLSLGRFFWQFTKLSDFNMIRFKIHGSQRDTAIKYDVSGLEDGTNYVFTCNISNATQGSFKWNEMMIYKSENLLPALYYEKTESGVTISTINRTYLFTPSSYTGSPTISMPLKNTILKPGTYTLTISSNANNQIPIVKLLDTSSQTIVTITPSFTNYKYSYTFTLTQQKTIASISFTFNSTKTSNIRYRIMLNEGDTAKLFTQMVGIPGLNLIPNKKGVLNNVYADVKYENRTFDFELKQEITGTSNIPLNNVNVNLERGVYTFKVVSETSLRQFEVVFRDDDNNAICEIYPSESKVYTNLINETRIKRIQFLAELTKQVNDRYKIIVNEDNEIDYNDSEFKYEKYGEEVVDYEKFDLTPENEAQILSFNLNAKTDIYYTSIPYNTLSLQVNNEQGYFSDYGTKSIVNKLTKDSYLDLYMKTKNENLLYGFSQGGISSSTGKDVDVNYEIRTDYYIELGNFKYKTKYTSSITNNRIYFLFYDENYNYIDYINFGGAKDFIYLNTSNRKYMRIAINTIDLTPFNPTQITSYDLRLLSYDEKILTINFDNISSSDYYKATLNFKSSLSRIPDLRLKDKYYEVFNKRLTTKSQFAKYIKDNYNLDVVYDDYGLTRNVIDTKYSNYASLNDLFLQAGTDSGNSISNAEFIINNYENKIKFKSFTSNNVDTINSNLQLERPIIRRNNTYQGLKLSKVTNASTSNENLTNYNFTLDGTLQNKEETYVLISDDIQLNALTLNDITHTSSLPINITVYTNANTFNYCVIKIEGEINTSFSLTIEKENLLKYINQQITTTYLGNTNDNASIIEISDNNRVYKSKSYFDFLLNQRPAMSYYELKTMGLPYVEIGDTIDVETDIGLKTITLTEIDLDFDGGLTETMRGYELSWDTLYPSDTLYPDNEQYPNTIR